MATILFIIAPKDFRDEEYFEPKAVLENAGHKAVTASAKIGTIIGSRGASATATLLLKDVQPKNYDAVVFIGGPGSATYDNNTDAHRVAQEFFASGKLTTAICHAPIILAKAGVLPGHKATVFTDDAQELIQLGVDYQPQSVVIDGTLITADGPRSATNFGKTIAAHLR